MWPAGRPRRLATILFLDIVGSTQIAAELGDRRWKALLDHFRAIVRAEIRRQKGHEEDTAGDGFFATFDQPAQAVRAAVAIVGRVHEIGVDVRCGLHFGEAESIERRRGGIAVHIGSRVMSLAGAAEVLVTTTVRDLIAGTQAELEDAGTHELKGVPGSWQVWRLRALDGKPLPEPMDPDDAAAVRTGHTAMVRGRIRRRLVIGGGVLAGVAVLAGVGAFVLIGPPPPTLVKIDPVSNSIVQTITDAYRSEHHPNSLWSVNGALWQASTQGFVGLVRRDMSTGAVQQTIPVSGDPQAGAFGFGSIWVGGLSGPSSVDRWDAVSGRSVAHLTVNATIASMDAGQTAVWVLGSKGDLFKVDPISNTVAGTYHTPTIGSGSI
jgi:class 3 adenylate cyclase